MAKKKKSKLARNENIYEEPNIILKLKDQYTDYRVYKLILNNITIAHAGIFKSGLYNYSIKNSLYDCHDAAIVRIICKEARNLGLKPRLNPKLFVKHKKH